MQSNDSPKPWPDVTILYRNHRGETRLRRIQPLHKVPGGSPFYFGVTKWHPEPQYLLHALDLEREGQPRRDFAQAGILAWGEPQVAAAVKFLAEPAPGAKARIEAILKDQIVVRHMGPGESFAEGFDCAAERIMEASGGLAFPRELTPELAEALGMPNFECGPIARAFREAGRADIRKRSENEQAFVLHWLAGLVLTHGANWRKAAGEALAPVIEAAQAEAVRNAAGRAVPAAGEPA